MVFYDRKEELQGLDRLYGRERGILAVAYGRRGIGKTTLIQRWITTRQHRAIFWNARPTSPQGQLQSFSQAIRAFGSSEATVQSDFTYASWDDAFEEILRFARRERLVVVLDDYDQLLACGSDLPGSLQRIWDLRLQSSQMMLFLIGSNVRAFEYDVLSYRAPMYGRAWWIAHLRPFLFAHLKSRLPNYSMMDRITLYACVGGVPRYLELLDPQLTLTQNLLRVLSSPMMREDADVILREQFDKPHLYAAVLESLARGNGDSKQIAQTLGVEHRDVSRCLKMLERAKIIRWEGPATARFPDTSRLGHYRIADQYFHFYFRCLASIRSLLERGQMKQAPAQLRESLDKFIGTEILPGLCREWLYRQWRKLPFHPQYVGAQWGEGTQPIDLVAINHEDHGILFGKCNWSKRPIGEADVRALMQQSVGVIPQPSDEWNVSYAFFSRSGFTRSARQAIGNAECFWVNLDDLDSGLQEDARGRGRGKLQV
jgi:AAA+ ATPase superfamily predicted ATPase